MKSLLVKLVSLHFTRMGNGGGAPNFVCMILVLVVKLKMVFEEFYCGFLDKLNICIFYVFEKSRL